MFQRKGKAMARMRKRASLVPGILLALTLVAVAGPGSAGQKKELPAFPPSQVVPAQPSQEEAEKIRQLIIAQEEKLLAEEARAKAVIAQREAELVFAKKSDAGAPAVLLHDRLQGRDKRAVADAAEISWQNRTDSG